MISKNADDRVIDVAVIGAGIGGAAAAVALSRAGLDVQAFEQASELREVGGAIILRQPSVTLFEQWGVLTDLQPKMVRINQIELRKPDGEVIRTMPIEFDEGEGEFAFSVHRADVHNALISACTGAIHRDCRARGVAQNGEWAEVTFENGRTIRARCVIGADGLGSTVRKSLDTAAMRFDKTVTHRTIAPASLLPADMPNDRLRMWSSGQLHAIVLPIRTGTQVAIDAAIPTETPPERLWSATSDDELLSNYADFDPLIARLVRGRVVDVTTHPVYDKDPLDRWTDGRVALLGDAAHPMAPRQGQGANQAIQDAGAISDALDVESSDAWPSALEQYASRRSPVTSRLQLLSRHAPSSSA